MDTCDHCNKEVVFCDSYGLCWECQKQQEHDYTEYIANELEILNQPQNKDEYEETLFKYNKEASQLDN